MKVMLFINMYRILPNIKKVVEPKMDDYKLVLIMQ